MDKFDELELNGRKLLESFLIQVGATNLHPTEDKFVKNGADCYSKIGHAVTVLRWQS